MAKEKFLRSKPHVNIGTIGHIDHGKTTLTAAICNVLSKLGQATARDYADIAKGGTVRDDTKVVTISVAHVRGKDKDDTRWRDAENLLVCRLLKRLRLPVQPDFYKPFQHEKPAPAG